MLSASSKYALRALLCLAKYQDNSETFMRVDVLSEEAGVPAPYLSKIIKILARKDIVETRRGLTGGVRLGANKKKITFFDICEALDEPIINEECLLSKKACNANAPCPLHHEWKKNREGIYKFLKRAKIFDSQ